ncbi:outer membrane lipoprotein carrier protein LolA [Gracilibacillus oryzae]|uniref:Outer membrane lipoprotein carrier protein LolA n=1 Tax=Gracilibacillus oryzae TaxID=1672701 RepID=A0A7C8L863_9BACI|nr:outer membrane lipoprotein carrier protein LolA [Gracilibacillus oryzae]KAB8137956.1 outer membrane lipoprotein carrier protein LolA [Gracilibacillus oryzae]
MKKYISIVIGLCFVILLAACGEKSKEDVVGKLEDMAEKMNGYQAQAVMTLSTGKEQQVYHIEVAHKKKDFYRVLLKNEQDEGNSQIILRNEEGVFVLTPALNKSFKFQSEWPANNSQPYLFQSLIKDVVDDGEAVFTQTENYYVFETKTSYESNSNLPYQKIYFDKKNFTPVRVEVMDHDKNTLVEVDYASFEIDPELPEDTFSMEKNMTSSVLGVPVMAQEELPQELTIYYPANSLGAELVEEDQMDTENGKRVMLSYEGERDFTLIQELVTSYPASTQSPELVNGEPADLGFTVGAMSEASLEWQYNGINYYLASDQLTKQELIDVATSVHAQAAK